MGTTATPSAPPRQRGGWKRGARLAGVVLVLYLLTAYLVMPAAWRHYERRHPSDAGFPRFTHTADGIPGDPLNVALVGTETEVNKVMRAARWYPASPLNLHNSLAIVLDSIFQRPDEDAPVSNLYLWGRKQDLAFEQPVGNNPRHGNRVRFWLSRQVDEDGRPLGVGAAIYDKRVGLSRWTGQVTHVTAADIDTERDKLFHDLEATGDLSRVEKIQGFHKVLTGDNGGGGPRRTDRALHFGGVASEEGPRKIVGSL